MHRSRPSSARRRPQVARRLEFVEALESRSLATESLGILAAGIGVAVAASAARADASGPARSQSQPSYAPSVTVRPVTPTSGATAGGGVMSTAAAPAGGTQGATVAPTATTLYVPQANQVTIAQPTAPVATAGGGGAIGTSHGGSGATSPFAPLVATAADAGAATVATSPPAIFALPAPGDGDTSNAATPPPAIAATSPAATSTPTPTGVSVMTAGAGVTPMTAGSGTASVATSGPAVAGLPFLTLDVTAGQVIYPGAYQLATLGASVELRGQVKNTAGATFSWNTSGLTKATAATITGANTADLQFQWATTNSTATTNSATLSVTSGGSVTTQTYTFAVPAGSGTASTATPTWPTVVTPDAEVADAPAAAVQDGSIDATSGAFDTAIALPSYNPNVPAVTLAYDSVTASPQPILDVHHTLDPTQAVPAASTAQLTFNGTAGATITTNTSQLIPGDVLQTPLQASATGLATGRYAYSVTTGDVRTNTTTVTTTGSVDIVDNASSAIGSGWTVAGLEKIIPSSGGVMLDLGMGGRSLWFATPASGTTYTDPAGEFSTLVANSNGTYTRTLTDGISYQFNAAGQETSAKNPAGIGDTYAYNANGTLNTITDNYNLVTTFAYTSGLLSGITDPDNRNTSFTHTGANLTGVTLPDSSTWGYAYTAGLLTSATDPDNHAMTVGYDAAGRATGVTNPDTTTESFANAQEAGTPASGTGTAANPAAPTLLAEVSSAAVDQVGDVTTVQPDWQGLGLTDVMADATGAISTAVRDGNGLGLIAGDPLNRFTQAAYDAHANVLKTTYPDGTTSSASYNSLAEPLTTVNRLGNTTTYGYDSYGDETSYQDAAGNSAEGWTYTNGLETGYTGPNLPTLTSGGGGGGSPQGTKRGATTNGSPGGGGGGVIGVGTVTPHVTIGYNGSGEATSSTLNGNTTSYTYNNAGMVLTVTNPKGDVDTYTYDAMNRLLSYKDGNNNTTTYTYDKAGNPLTVADALNHTTTTAYDAMNRPTTVTDPLSEVTTTGYDAAGRVTSVTDPDNNTTTYTLDADGRTLTTTDALNHTSSVTYDADGEVTSTTDADNRTISFTYNPMGQVLTETWGSPAAPVDVITSTYDNGGELTKITDNSATLTYTYDKDGNQLTASTAGTTGEPTTILTTTYAGDGFVTGLSDNESAAASIKYYYDASARLMGITSTYGTGAGPQVLLGYDADSNLTSEARSISYSSATVSSTLGYDEGNRLTSIGDTGASNTSLDSFTYGYDAANRLMTQTNAEGTTNYTYNNADELTGTTGASTATYSYDANGNRTMSGYTTGTNNEETAGAGYTDTYDNDGNLLTKTQTSTGDVWTYTWDYRNRLTGVVEKNSGGTTLMQGTYTYDPLDRRIGSLEMVGGTTTTLWTVYNGTNPYADYDGSGNLLDRYLTGCGTDEYLARITGPGVLSWYLTDDEGSIRDVVSAYGSEIDHVAYDAYGNVTGESSPSNGDRFKFDGMAYDAALGDYYDNARYYDPTSGRFISQDPSGFGAGDSNIYRFAANSPSGYIDTSGLEVRLYKQKMSFGQHHIAVVVYDPATQTGVLYNGGALDLTVEVARDTQRMVEVVLAADLRCLLLHGRRTSSATRTSSSRKFIPHLEFLLPLLDSTITIRRKMHLTSRFSAPPKPQSTMPFLVQTPIPGPTLFSLVRECFPRMMTCLSLEALRGGDLVRFTLELFLLSGDE